MFSALNSFTLRRSQTNVSLSLKYPWTSKLSRSEMESYLLSLSRNTETYQTASHIALIFALCFLWLFICQQQKQLGLVWFYPSYCFDHFFQTKIHANIIITQIVSSLFFFSKRNNACNPSQIKHILSFSFK